MKLETLKPPSTLIGETLTVADVVETDGILREVHFTNGTRITQGQYSGIYIMVPAKPKMIKAYTLEWLPTTPSQTLDAFKSFTFPFFEFQFKADDFKNGLGDTLGSHLQVVEVQVPDTTPLQ